jgi:tryptophanyl-tRNA synthetase
MKTVFSGIQPTGNLHLGNYLGAIKPWREMLTSSQNTRFFFSIVDMHAITVFQNPEELRTSVFEMLATYIASGLNAQNTILFKQSSVKEHAELSWILSCNTPLGWLDRMTQYKDKTKENKARECLGLYAYPCLMSADILLYNTNEVPVGEDQKQHIELARDIAVRMNTLYKQELFVVPEAKISRAKRVMSLKDGSKKMSKSDPAEGSRINIKDSADEIVKKISKATTGELSSPEVANLQTIYKEITGKDYNLLQNPSFAVFKKELAEAIVSELEPISQEFKRLMNERGELERILAQNGEKAREVAERNMAKIKAVIGF